jgi:beta-lactamase class A
VRAPSILAVAVFTACTATHPPAAPAPTPARTTVQRRGEAALMHQLDAAIRGVISGAPGEVAVSLVDLQGGGRLDIHADVSMHAASTMKVPVLLELFRQAAAGRLSLHDSVEVRNSFTSIADGSSYALSPDDDSETALYKLVGQRLPLLDLARRMIDWSSNLATNNLIDLVTADSVQSLMHRLGTDSMVVLRGVEDIPAFRKGLNNHTTARALADVFAAIARCERGDVAPALTPLRPADCRQITDILAGQEFNEKIPAGIPAGVRVAHKTGWITGIDHDAGIVYPPGQAPYILAILTRGFDSTAVADSLARRISAVIWQQMVVPRMGRGGSQPQPPDADDRVGVALHPAVATKDRPESRRTRAPARASGAQPMFGLFRLSTSGSGQQRVSP